MGEKYEVYDSLPPKRRKFIDAYLTNGGNGVDAYYKAGYTGKRNTATSSASKWLAEEDTRKALQERIEPDEIKRRLLIDEIMENFISMAKGEPRIQYWQGEENYMTPNPSDQINAWKSISKFFKEDIRFDTEERELKLEYMRASIDLLRSKAKSTEDMEDVLEREIGDLLKELEDGGKI